MKPSSKLQSVLNNIGQRLAQPATLAPHVEDQADAPVAAAIAGAAFQDAMQAALAEAKTDATPKTAAEKAAAQATKACRSLALALLALAAGHKPDVRAVHGWRTLLQCPTRKALHDAVQRQLREAAEAFKGAGLDQGDGPEARVGKRGTYLTTGKAPLPHQQARKLLAEAWAAASSAALTEAPAANAGALSHGPLAAAA